MPSARASTGAVFVIVLVTKFAGGAWIVVLTAPLLFLAMKAIARHYARVAEELAPAAAGVAVPSRVHGVVLVSNLLAPTLQALAFAQAGSPASLRAVKVSETGGDDHFADAWQERGVPLPLVILESPYRETVRPIVRYVRRMRREHPGDVIAVTIPEYVVAHWWEHVLHNQTALRLKARLLYEPSVTVTSVPWLLSEEDKPVTTISARIEIVQSSDLLDEPTPTRRRDPRTLPRIARSPDWSSAALGLPLLTLAIQAAR